MTTWHPASYVTNRRRRRHGSAKNSFYAWFFTNARLSWSVFSGYRARVSKCKRPRPQLAIWALIGWSIFEFLARDFPKTSCTDHIARSILPSLSPCLNNRGRDWKQLYVHSNYATPAKAPTWCALASRVARGQEAKRKRTGQFSWINWWASN